MVKKAIACGILIIMFFLGGLEAAGLDAGGLIDLRAMTLVFCCAAALALARCAPGIIIYRMAVLDAPQRHILPERERAQIFAAGLGRNLLLVSLIFMLAEAASALESQSASVAVAGGLSTALLAALYMLTFCIFFSYVENAVSAFGRSNS